MKKPIAAFALLIILSSVTLNIILFFLIWRSGGVRSPDSSNLNTAYLQSLEKKVKEYEDKIVLLESANKETAKNSADTACKVGCLELVKKTPSSGNARYVGIDIVGYYNDAKARYEEVQRGEYSREGDEEDNIAEKEYWTRNYNEATPLYEEYMRQCK